MKIHDGIAEGIVTAYTDVLPKHCLYCGGVCWHTANYTYACRCSRCSAYFHRKIITCIDLEREGYDAHFCIRDHKPHTLRLFEIDDGRLVEVCQGCANWLYEEGYLEKELGENVWSLH
jgi:hypothetical protein